MKVKLVSVSPAAPRLKIIVKRFPALVGRSPDAEVCLSDRWISRRHCELDQVNGTLVVRDIGFRHGIFVNGERITVAPVLPGDEISMGVTSFGDYRPECLMEITNRPPLVFVRGEGSWLWDHEGKRYLDFVQGWAVNCLGHCPPAIVEALDTQSRTLITPSPALYNEPAMGLAARIVEHSCFQRVFFANSGAEANEGAIKLARKWGALHKGGALELMRLMQDSGA